MKTVTKAELQEQLESSEKLMQGLNETWEEKLQKTQEVHKEREKALEELGITVEKNMIGVHAPKKMPHLVNLNEGAVWLVLRKSRTNWASRSSHERMFGIPAQAWSNCRWATRQ